MFYRHNLLIFSIFLFLFVFNGYCKATQKDNKNDSRNSHLNLLQMAEENVKDNGECFMKRICSLATLDTLDIFPQHSFAKGFMEYIGTIKVALRSLSPDETNKKFPLLHKLISSYDYGQENIGNMEACENQFDCDVTSAKILVTESLIDDQYDSTSLKGLFNHCNVYGKLCPGITLGCAMCGIMNPGACNDICVIGAMLCVKGGLGCKTILEQRPRTCQPGWSRYNGNCYKLFKNRVDFETASQSCNSHQSHLVKILNEEENEFLVSLMVDGGVEDIYIGLNDRAVEGMYVWEHGNDLATFTNWRDEDPDDFNNSEDCVHLSLKREVGKWNDIDCNNPYDYICYKKLI